MDDMTTIRACLYGGAMGDALGAEIEFWSLEQIRARIPRGLTELPPHDGRAGRITDDTQMTLFTAEGLIRAVVRGQACGICVPEGVVHHALLCWYRTQGGVPKMDLCDGAWSAMLVCARGGHLASPACPRLARHDTSGMSRATTARAAVRSCGWHPVR